MSLFLATDDLSSIWKVPISISYPTTENSSLTTPKLWLETERSQMEPDSKPYILNVKGTGYFRVNYDEENWKSLTSFLKESDHHSIHQLNRAQLVDDIMNLARSQKVDYDLAMDLLLYLKSENEYIPWSAAFRTLDYVKTRMAASDENSALFKTLILDLLEDRYLSLGFTPQDSEEHLTILSRMGASSWMCELDYEDCVINAQTFFQQWMTNE